MVVSKKLSERYQTLKQQVPDCLLLMQVGAFLQVMNEDARKVAEITGIKLQMAGDVDAPLILGGFPKSGLDKYIGKLLRAEQAVAVAMQDDNKQRHISEILRVRVEKREPENGTL